jgi:sigma-B regulation protein RsbU (phosphoserine phosphatase)
MGNGEWRIENCHPHLPVGVFDDFTYSVEETHIEPNSTIFLYTDGLTEAKNSQHKLFGLERVKEVLAGCLVDSSFSRLGTNVTSPNDLIETMIEAVHQFVGDAEQSDDLTMMAIRYTPQQYECILSEKLVIKNDVKEVSKLSEFIKSVLEKQNIEKSLGLQLRLAVEEAVVNVIDYAYPVGQEGEIEVRVLSDGKTMKTVIIDSGVAFDPTAKERADTTLSAEDRQIGGLGILMVREIMDSINYERINHQNVLTLVKQLRDSSTSETK